VDRAKIAAGSAAAGSGWQSPGDPRALNGRSYDFADRGAAIGSHARPSLGRRAGAVNRMKFHGMEWRASREPRNGDATGSAWNYNDGNYVILSELIREASAATRRSAAFRAAGIVRPARHAQKSTLEFDASGHPEGSSKWLATREANLGKLPA